MASLPAITIQAGLIFGPVVLFLVLKSRCRSRWVQLLFSVFLAAGSGACAFHFSSGHGWKPVMKSGRPVDIPPVALFWIFFGTILIILLLLVFSKMAGERVMAEHGNTDGSEATRGWRVGHSGRDSMYYEEFRGGGWERLVIDGEMLMGPAHHVIYFDSPAQWENYPEWARERREEIIGRIKSEFAPPDYEYHGG